MRNKESQNWYIAVIIASYALVSGIAIYGQRQIIDETKENCILPRNETQMLNGYNLKN